MSELAAETTVPATRLSGKEAADAIAGGALLIDIRPKHRRAERGTIEGAVAVAKPELVEAVRSNRVNRAGPEQKLVLFCGSERGTEQWVEDLKAAGVDNVFDVAGGFSALTAEGLPVVSAAS